MQIIVIAKAPVPGHVKTRLCPPCTPVQAAAIASAALADTLASVASTPAARRTLAIAGDYAAPRGFHVVRQRGSGLGERLANAFADTRLPEIPSLLIGMDTPQATASMLAGIAAGLDDADAVLAPAADGGWWALALRDPGHARVLAGVGMSLPDTGVETRAALRRLGLRIAIGPMLRDVDTVADALAIASSLSDAPGKFVESVQRNFPVGGRT